MSGAQPTKSRYHWWYDSKAAGVRNAPPANLSGTPPSSSPITDSPSKASTTKASPSKASTTKASPSKASTTKASPSKASTTKDSPAKRDKPSVTDQAEIYPNGQRPSIPE